MANRSGKQPSTMRHSFAAVATAEIERSSFNHSHGYKTTFDAGWLVPFYVGEALPGDTFNMHATTFARLQTPKSPYMDNMWMDTFFFAVPYRLVFDNWEKLQGAQDNPGDSIAFTLPTSTSPGGGYAVMSLQDYMGIPPGIANIVHQTLPLRAYQLCWNEWFRDQNLQNSITVDKDGGPDTPANYVLRRRGKRHDYFTSALPWPQKGTEVSLPLGTTAPVRMFGGVSNVANAQATANILDEDGNTVVPVNTWGWSGASMFWADQINSSGNLGVAGHLPYTTVDLSSATAATINDLRLAMQTQRLIERDARGGTRYVEILWSHWKVKSDDARLQRSEYLGGGSTAVNVNPVAQTSETNVTAQGTLTGFAVASGGSGFTKSFTEHCVVLGLVNVRADLNYQQGLDRMWRRSTRYDFAMPVLAHLGEQAIRNQEIYCNPADGQDDDTFGYIPRYDEYRHTKSQITGKFRSNVAGSLDLWHLAQDFAARPSLNATFIEDNPPVDRVIAVPTEPHFYFDAYLRLTIARALPTYGTPGLMDHF